MLQILQITRVSLISIPVYFHMENSIFVLKFTGKLPRHHSVPNLGHLLNWLTHFLILNHIHRNVSLLKGYLRGNY